MGFDRYHTTVVNPLERGSQHNKSRPHTRCRVLVLSWWIQLTRVGCCPYGHVRWSHVENFFLFILYDTRTGSNQTLLALWVVERHPQWGPHNVLWCSNSLQQWGHLNQQRNFSRNKDLIVLVWCIQDNSIRFWSCKKSDLSCDAYVQSPTAWCWGTWSSTVFDH